MRQYEASKTRRPLLKMALCYLSKRASTTPTPTTAAPPPPVRATISETNVYYAYTRSLEEQTAAPCSGPGELAQDLEAAAASGGGTVVPAGTRMRLHYPMQSHTGTTYMLAAMLDPVTAQFSFGWVKVYSEATGHGGAPVRHVGDFEV